MPRRSLYFQHAAEKQMEFLQIFDGAGVTECYRRKESILPQQALALANSDLSLRQARRLARALSMQAGSDSASFVTAAFEQVLTRGPTEMERTECLGFLGEGAGWCEREYRRAEHSGETRRAKLPRPTRPYDGAKAWSTCS